MVNVNFVDNRIYILTEICDHFTCIFIYNERWLIIVIKVFLYYLVNTFVFAAIPNYNQFICLLLDFS